MDKAISTVCYWSKDDRLIGDGKDVLVTEWTKNDLTSDDIILDTEK